MCRRRRIEAACIGEMTTEMNKAHAICVGFFFWPHLCYSIALRRRRQATNDARPAPHRPMTMLPGSGAGCGGSIPGPPVGTSPPPVGGGGVVGGGGGPPVWGGGGEGVLVIV